ncbi:hypothetical protein [Mesorhizobium sp.]|nr:hypothetical protein [Mesorhizobium sp.]
MIDTLLIGLAIAAVAAVHLALLVEALHAPCRRRRGFDVRNDE